jgi:ADP-ribosylglycohydrolase
MVCSTVVLVIGTLPLGDRMEEFESHRGALLGLAVGDALGAPLEGLPPGSFEPVSGMTGGGSHGLQPGHWTDDTSMALCLAESLLECRGFDPVDQLSRYVRWYREGHLSSTGYCFGMGSTTQEALTCFEESGEPYSGSTHPNAAGNGSIMRLAPVPLFYARNPEEAVERSADSSRTTHGAPNCVDACRYFGALIVGAVNGAGKAELLSERYSPVPGMWEERPLAPEVDEVARGSFRENSPPEIRGSGYVVRSLEAALWAFHRSDTFEEGCLLAANLGDDADTTAAVYGQIAGAFYGEGGIPEGWRSKLAHRDLIESYAGKLHELRP